jgi:hypothetical protein
MHSCSCLEFILSIWITDLNGTPKNLNFLVSKEMGNYSILYLGYIKEFWYDKNAGSAKDLDTAGCWLG